MLSILTVVSGNFRCWWCTLSQNFIDQLRELIWAFGGRLVDTTPSPLYLAFSYAMVSLLCQARSKEVSQYLIEVPTFGAAISDARFLKEDTLTRPHGLVWPLLLRAGNRQNKSANLECLSQAEDMLIFEVNHPAEIADDQDLISNTVVLTVSFVIHVAGCY